MSSYVADNPQTEAAINKYGDGEIGQPFLCIASDCMMWRKELYMRDKTTGELYSASGLICGDEYEFDETHGFCGLVERP
jgi:hypothetical protein